MHTTLNGVINDIEGVLITILIRWLSSYTVIYITPFSVVRTLPFFTVYNLHLHALMFTSMHVNVDCIYIEHNFVLQEFILQDIVYMALQKGSH